MAFTDRECDSQILRNPGFFHFRSGGEKHVNDPDSIAALQVRILEYYPDFAKSWIFPFSVKGQIISECPHEIIVYPKIATKIFLGFLSWKFTTSRLVQNRVYLLANRT